MDRSVSEPPTDPMHSLLSAVQELSDLDHRDLDGMLQRTVEIACQMTGARYGAMGVLAEGETDRLSHFITHGLTERERQAIGEPPHARGILGRLIREPTGLRLADLTQEPDAVGFPPGHPDMRTFLGMPIRTGSTVFGNLYLTETDHVHGFTEQDELTVQALATLAGVVIDLTRRRLEADTQRVSSDTIRQINRSLLTERDAAQVLPLTLQQARQIRGAETAAVIVDHGDDRDPRLEILAAEGPGAEALLVKLRPRITECLDMSRAMHWAVDAPRLLLDHQAGPRHTSLVPVFLRDGTSVVLLVAGWRPATTVTTRFTENLMESLADQIGLILNRIAADENRDALRKVRDRERIARDLHDLVIQRIFAAGLTLQGAGRLRPEPEVLDRIERTIEELDATIRDIRATIFALTPPSPDISVEAEAQDLIHSYAAHLGFAPTLRCSGPIHAVVNDDIRLALLLVLREALSNVARHASATSVDIELRVGTDRLMVVVTDDGVGLPPEVVESGLGNIRARARQGGGSMDLLARTPRGTVLRWQVPLHREED